MTMCWACKLATEFDAQKLKKCQRQKFKVLSPSRLQEKKGVNNAKMHIYTGLKFYWNVT